MVGTLRRRVVACAPATVWGIVCVHLALLVLYSFAMPAFRSPDEPNHIDVVRLLANGESYPDFDARRTDPQLLAARDEVAFARQSRHLERGAATPRAQRPAFGDLAPSPTVELNQIVQHPPLYYALIATEFRIVNGLAPGDPFRSYDRQIGAFRLLSALWLAPLPLIVWKTAKRIGLTDAAALTSTLMVLTIPQLQHLGSSVNNDTLFIVISGCITLAVARVLSGDASRRVLGVIGALIGVALFTKAFAFVYPLWLVGVLAISARRREARFDFLGAAMAFAIAFLSGGWWWLRNLVRVGESAPSIETANRLKTQKGFVPHWPTWIQEGVLGVGKRFFGNFGWYDVAIPYRVMIVDWLLVAAVIAIAIGARRRPKASTVDTDTGPLRSMPPSRVDAAVMFAPFVLLAVFLAINAARLYARSGVFALLQGRYLFGAVVGLCVLTGIAWCVITARHRRLHATGPAIVLGAAVAMHAFALRAVLGFYWGNAQASTIERVRTMLAWSPWPPAFSLAAAISGVAALIWTTLLIARSTVRSVRT